MASENQGLHAALIVLFILVLLLSVATFMFFKEYKDSEVRSKTDKAAAAAADTQVRKIQEEFNEIVKIIGVPVTGTGDFEEVKKAFEADKGTYLANVPEDKRFYRQALEELNLAIKAAQKELTAVQDTLAAERLRIGKAEEAAQKQVTEVNAELSKVREDLAKEKAINATNQTNAQAEIRNAVELSGRTQAEKTAEIDRLTKEVEQHKATIVARDNTIKQLVEVKEKYIPKPTDLFDGEVRTIDQRNRLVYINRGSFDNLKRGTIFTVHSPGTQPTSQHKAKIEVQDILDGHQATARILEDDIKNPILPNDQIYTVLWDPGQIEHFAVAGRIDLDGDNADDYEQVLVLIKGSGGVIDATVDDEGKVTGAIKPGTRYLILGTEPKQSAMTAYNKMVADAKQLGVQIIPGDRFLDQINWKNPNSVVRYGTNSNINDVPMPAPPGGVPSNRDTLPNFFRQRLPPSAQPNSAYPDAAAPAPAASPM